MRHLFPIVCLLTFALDQLSKWWLADRLPAGQSYAIIRNILYIRPLTNTGAAFGILQANTPFLIFVSFITIALLFRLRARAELCPSLDFAFGLMLGGAAGNLIDRLRFGHVYDFIDFSVPLFRGYTWPVFNIADSAITIGVIILLADMFMKSPFEEPEEEEVSSEAANMSEPEQAEPFDGLRVTGPKSVPFGSAQDRSRSTES